METVADWSGEKGGAGHWRGRKEGRKQEELKKG